MAGKVDTSEVFSCQHSSGNAGTCTLPYICHVKITRFSPDPQDYLLAIQVYESLLEQLPVVQGQLQSVIGRLYLSLGDLPSSQTYFSQVASGGEEEGEVEGRDRAVMAHINQ